MPFDKKIPHSFTANAIRGYAPALPGVYGISSSREWIYIGQAANIQAALTQHLREASSEFMKHGPAGFVYEVCPPERQHARRSRLIEEYTPVCSDAEMF